MQLENIKRKKPLEKRFSNWDKAGVVSRVSALLMIKQPYSSPQEKFKTSLKESQLVDIHPTILSSIGATELIRPNIDGVDLFTEATPNRSKYFTFFMESNSIPVHKALIYDISYSPTGGITDVKYRGKLYNGPKFSGGF